MKRLRVSALVVITLAGTTTSANAYIDPVAGSFVIQGIAAGLAGAMVAFRSLRTKVFAVLLGKTRRSGGKTGSVPHDS